MAHKQKYTRGAVGHMFAHYDRSKEIPGLKRAKVRTLQIDFPDQSVEKNYNLAETDQPQPQLEFLHQRLGEVKVHKRKDVNVMIDWVLTVPKDLPGKEYEDFFKASYDFLNQRYGKENVVSAYVHMDETTPHMHFAFVPVVNDKKTGKPKLSAKEAVTRDDLRSFHGDLSNHLERKLGHKVSVLNEATREGNKSIAELKRESASEMLEEATIKRDKIVSETKNKVEAMESMLLPIRAEYEAKNAYVEKCKEVSEIAKTLPSYAKIRPKSFFDREEVVVVPAKMWIPRQVASQEDKLLALVGENLESYVEQFRDQARIIKSQRERLHKAETSNKILGNLRKILPDILPKLPADDVRKIQNVLDGGAIVPSRGGKEIRKGRSL